MHLKHLAFYNFQHNQKLSTCLRTINGKNKYNYSTMYSTIQVLFMLHVFIINHMKQ